MKLIKSTIAVLAIASSSLFAVGGQAQAASCGAGAGEETWPISAPDYVTRNCAFCHGVGVQGRAVAPRLAGQHRTYIVTQFERFRDHSRDNPFSRKYMWHVAVKTLPENVCELGAYLSSLPPEPADDGNEALAAAGADIFEHGVPNDNIPACQFCHGPEAQGIGKVPRLGGLSYEYLKRRLQQWAEGYNATAEKMPAIAPKLSPDQVEAVASYLSFVPAAPSRGEF